MMNDTYPYPYPYSSAEARDRNELPLWRESHKANIACRNAIEDAIRQNFDGMHLNKDCITPVLEEYGYKRTAWVLASFFLSSLSCELSVTCHLDRANYNSLACSQLETLE